MDKGINKKNSIGFTRSKTISNQMTQLCAFLKDKYNILMLLIILIKIIAFVLLFTLKYNLTVLICEMVTMIIICVSFGFKIKYETMDLIINWINFFSFYPTQFVIHFLTIVSDETKRSDKEFYIVIMFLNFLIQNSIFFVRDGVLFATRRKKAINLIIWVIFNVITLLIINSTYSFIYESLPYSYCLFFIYFKYYISGIELNEPSLRQKSNNKFCNYGNYNNKHYPWYDSIPAFYGSCIINENFMIKYQNSYFLKYMNHLCINKGARNELLDESKNNNNNNNILLKSIIHPNSSTAFCCLTLNASYIKLNIPVSLYLAADFISYCDDDDESYNNLSLTDIFNSKFKCHKGSETLIDPNEQQEQEGTGDKFIYLGRFRYFDLNKEERYFFVHSRKIDDWVPTSETPIEDLYEIAFYDVTDQIKKNQRKMEKKYKNLLLRKITHEFKGPIVLIQNLLSDVIEIDSVIHFKNLSITIKYVTETILLLVSDLTEYIHLNTLEIEEKELKTASGKVELIPLNNDIENMCFVYKKVYNKDVNIVFNFDFDDKLKHGKITINETKLKQILVNIITNSIKNSTNIKITFKQSRFFISQTIKHDVEFIEKKKTITINNYDKTKKTFPKQHSLNSEGHSKYGLSIIIEDDGPGIEQNIINIINSSSNTKHQCDDILLSPVISCSSYKNQKGLGAGLTICLKLCKDLNIDIKCEKLNQTLESHGTKFILKLNSQIELNSFNDLIKDFEQYRSQSGVTEHSTMTKRLDIFHISSNEKQFLQYDQSNQLSCESRFTTVPRKSKTSLFFKPNFNNNNGNDLNGNFILAHQQSFEIIPTQKPKGKTSINIVKKNMLDIPTFNGIYNEYTLPKENYILKDKRHNNRNSLFLKPNLTSLPYIGVQDSSFSKEKDKKTNNIEFYNSTKFGENTSRMKCESSQILSLLNENIKVSKSSKNNDNEVKESLDSTTRSKENKGIIIIVDDIDSNKKSIHSLLNKYLEKNNKSGLYEYNLLSDGIELLNMFYNDKFSNKNLIKIIFCDESMNYLNGSDTFKILQNICMSKKLKEIPFVICSAFSDNGFREKLVSIGIKDIYEKPLKSSDIEKIATKFKI